MTIRESMLDPIVLAALFAALSAAFAPMLAARIKRGQNGRIAAVENEVRRNEAGHLAAQKMLDRLQTEVDEQHVRIRALEQRERILHDTLVLVEAELVVISARLGPDHDMAGNAMRVLELVRDRKRASA